MRWKLLKKIHRMDSYLELEQEQNHDRRQQFNPTPKQYINKIRQSNEIHHMKNKIQICKICDGYSSMRYTGTG